MHNQKHVLDGLIYTHALISLSLTSLTYQLSLIITFYVTFGGEKVWFIMYHNSIYYIMAHIFILTIANWMRTFFSLSAIAVGWKGKLYTLQYILCCYDSRVVHISMVQNDIFFFGENERVVMGLLLFIQHSWQMSEVGGRNVMWEKRTLWMPIKIQMAIKEAWDFCLWK